MIWICFCEIDSLGFKIDGWIKFGGAFWGILLQILIYI